MSNLFDFLKKHNVDISVNTECQFCGFDYIANPGKTHKCSKGKELSVGDEVWDDLTRSYAKIVRMSKDERGNVGYWIDNDWLEGGRHPWEVESALDRKLRFNVRL